MVITAATAEGILQRDLERVAAQVEPLLKVPVTANQFGALVSFAFNCGVAALCSSTLLRLLNLGDYEGAAGQFERWNKGGGKILAGLVARRAAERALFLSEERC